MVDRLTNPTESGSQTVNKKRNTTAFIEENENETLLDKVMPFEKVMQAKPLNCWGIIKE